MDQKSKGQDNNLTSKDDRYFRTPDFYLAAYLFVQKLWLVNIDRTDRSKCLFVFRDTPERQDLVSNFRYAKEALIDARQYAFAVRKLNSKLYETNF